MPKPDAGPHNIELTDIFDSIQTIRDEHPHLFCDPSLACNEKIEVLRDLINHLGRAKQAFETGSRIPNPSVAQRYMAIALDTPNSQNASGCGKILKECEELDTHDALVSEVVGHIKQFMPQAAIA